jgi:hypothetical protein
MCMVRVSLLAEHVYTSSIQIASCANHHISGPDHIPT